MSTTPTKIMYLVDHFQGPQAGTEGQLLQLLGYLDRSRYDPAITFLRTSEYIEQNSLVCPVRVLGISKLASIGSIFKVLRYALTLRRERYRIVHCFFNDVSVIAPPILRIFGIRVLVSRRDMGFWYTPSKLAALRIVSVFVDCYVANCQAVKQVVRQREWVPGRKILVIYNGFVPRQTNASNPAETITLPNIPDQDCIVGIVANLKPIKCIDVLIRAVAIASKQCPSIRLVIIGNDGVSTKGRSMREELENLSSQLGIHDRVIFTGPIDNPAPHIDRFAVAVLCSESEGFSNAVIEYMQSGRPTICTDTGGNPELVRDGYNGFLVPVGDVDALADRLVRLLSSSALARRLGEAARKTVDSTYSHARMLMEHMRCYDAVLSAGRPVSGFKRAAATIHKR